MEGWRHVFAPQASPQGRQRAEWCQTIEAFDEGGQACRFAAAEATPG
jgi:hypothetical protein